MFAIGNLLEAISYILRISINFLQISIIISVIMSFLVPYYSKIRAFFDGVSDIILNPIRRYLPVHAGPFDLSPAIAILVLIFLDRFLIQTLFDIASRLG
ncbi:YggT family protein [Geotoga petraea]|jgi:YggT family protein|uniref:YggT family protein n=1 Tax=Geotoga petraea TaxID=28234 RepID=A0A1G6JI62_9BACT|nr:YggT family protein [Geotoga petraea]MDK2946425.1 YggT family protein [Geotoga sp.]TGG88228.1 YggT family protein [Geotoga petraea]SDC18403.1 YggT family protein [Geotoga petraea]